MKKILTMKQGEKRAKETERGKKDDKLCCRSALLLSVVHELHRTDSRRTQNTGTLPTDITLSNKL